MSLAGILLLPSLLASGFSLPLPRLRVGPEFFQILPRNHRPGSSTSRNAIHVPPLSLSPPPKKHFLPMRGLADGRSSGLHPCLRLHPAFRETQQNIGVFPLFLPSAHAPISARFPSRRHSQKNFAKKVDAVNNSALCYATTRWKWNEFMFDLVSPRQSDQVLPGRFHTPMFSEKQHILLKQNNLCAIWPQEARR